jgi:co-chaperonin GroES (HSP10)
MAHKRIQPLGNKLIVDQVKKEVEKVDSIYIPETANANLQEGKVVEVSKEIEHLVKKGDTVIYSSGAGSGIFYKGKPHLVLQVHEVWGVMEREEESKPTSEQN